MFPVENGKFALVRASMVLTYYFKLFHTGADRHNGISISMSLLLLVAKTEEKFRTGGVYSKQQAWMTANQLMFKSGLNGFFIFNDFW